MTGALFDLPGNPNIPHPAEIAETLSPDQRRTRRQYAALKAGQHPLGLLLKHHIRLHPDAAPADDRKAAGLRCGDCRFRTLVGRPIRSVAKCAQATATHGPASDNRRWWPACERFEPKDEGPARRDYQQKHGTS